MPSRVFERVWRQVYASVFRQSKPQPIPGGALRLTQVGLVVGALTSSIKLVRSWNSLKDCAEEPGCGR